MDMVLQVVPGVLSGLSLAVITWIARKLGMLAARFGAIEAAQKNQLKAQIVAAYERSMERGCITPMELETVNRMVDSYFALGGNNYIHALVKRLNDDIPVRGETIPDQRQ